MTHTNRVRIVCRYGNQCPDIGGPCPACERIDEQHDSDSTKDTVKTDQSTLLLDNATQAAIKARHLRSLEPCRLCLGFGEISYFGQMVRCTACSAAPDPEKTQAIADRAVLLAALEAEQQFVRNEAKLLMIDMPEPGSDMAKVLRVNSMLRAKVMQLQAASQRLLDNLHMADTHESGAYAFAEFRAALKEIGK